MDPITAFSLACGVIQVVDFGFKVIREVWTIVNSPSGTSTEYEELEAVTSILQGLMNGLKAQKESINARHTTGAMQNPGDVAISSSTAQAIQQIASECEQTAGKLINLLNKIKADPKQYKSTVSLTLKAIKAIPKFRKVTKLELELQGYREKLEKHIILDLRQTSRALLNGMTQGFEDMQAEHKDITAAIANNESNIVKLMKSEGVKIRGDIAAVGKKLDDAENKQNLQLFVHSFAFEGIFEREDRIGRQPAAPRTFRWLFDRNHSRERHYDSFMDWLEGDQSIYWICGKAGSGKSTLMSFIWDHPDSKKDEHLQKWAANNELITAGVFFWHQGSQLQKSSEGLLRSLIFQILRQNESRANRMMELPNISQGANPSWSEARLLALLISVLDESDIRVCFFIDGLDEYSDGDVVANNSLLKNIFKLTTHANGRLKCCLSSRPLRSFELGLEKYPKLMLHKLTRPDIARYVADSLGDSADSYLIERILYKANGVFLWAFFAVRSLQTALINGDTRDQVRSRLGELPSELNDLYSHMLLKIDRMYWREAALYLALADYKIFPQPTSVLHYVMASKDNYFEELTLPWTRKRIRALRQDCANMEKWLKVRTAGLLEVETVRWGHMNGIGGRALDEKAEDDSSEDRAANGGLSESRLADGGETNLPGTDADLAIYYDLLELRKGTELTLKSEAILNGPSDEKAIEHSLFHRKVVSIHRSVTQFFESEKQNEILKICPEGTAVLKSIQADVVLLTFRDRFGFRMDHYFIPSYLDCLMSSARDAEAHTKQPNRPYIDRLGSALKSINGPEWPASVPENFATTFLGFTAEHWLCLYVQDVLNNDPPTGKENRQSVLNDTFRCATSTRLIEKSPYMSIEGQQLKLINFLLDEGADPNDIGPRRRTSGNMTAWKGFLGLAIMALDSAVFGVLDDLHISDFRHVLKRFIACGADPRQEFVCPLRSAGPHFRPRGEQWHYECTLRANTTFVLEQHGLPCDPAQSCATVETVFWHRPFLWPQDEGKTYHTTPEGSVMLLEAFIARWNTRSGTPEQWIAERECYRRCLELRKSVHAPDYTEPGQAEPLAEHYKGGQKPSPEEEECSSDGSDEGSEDGTFLRALAWQDVI